MVCQVRRLRDTPRGWAGKGVPRTAKGIPKSTPRAAQDVPKCQGKNCQIFVLGYLAVFFVDLVDFDVNFSDFNDFAWLFLILLGTSTGRLGAPLAPFFLSWGLLVPFLGAPGVFWELLRAYLLISVVVSAALDACMLRDDP